MIRLQPKITTWPVGFTLYVLVGNWKVTRPEISCNGELRDFLPSPGVTVGFGVQEEIQEIWEITSLLLIGAKPLHTMNTC
jgi:hypothetical protein